MPGPDRSPFYRPGKGPGKCLSCQVPGEGPQGVAAAIAGRPVPLGCALPT